MSVVVVLWCTNVALALTLAGFCVLSWLVERRDLANLAFCFTALATAAAAPLELEMMYAQSPAEYGNLLRWYHLPIFFVLVGHLFFVRYYLDAGRRWLLGTVLALRAFVLTANFFVRPNYNFREIASLQHISFLGERVAVVGASVPRPWQVLAAASMFLLVGFVVDASIQARLKGSPEARRRAVVVLAAIVVPMICNLVVNQLVVSGVLHTPISATLWFLGTLIAIAYELGREFVLSRRAQVQLAELRGELAQLERVNALGQLASGLAHDLVQPLTASVGNADAAARLLTRENPDLQTLREIIVDIQNDSRRAGAMIDRMRALLKRRTVEMQPVPLEEVVRDVLSLAGPAAASSQVVLRSSVAAGLPQVLCDRVHISQVLLNLLINGIEAAKSCPSEERRVVVEASSDGNGAVEVAVADSGPGIPDTALEQVFNPLYTTKTDGLGMGLALSRTIIEAHGGRLWVDTPATAPGATFRFTLQRA